MTSAIHRAEESERAVLGSILLDNAALEIVWPQLEPDDFYDERNRRIFRKLQEMGASRTPIDLLTVKAAFTADELEKVGAGYLASLTNEFPRVANVAHYAAEVKKASRLRQVLSAAKNAEAAILEGDESADIAISELRARTAEYQIAGSGKSLLRA